MTDNIFFCTKTLFITATQRYISFVSNLMISYSLIHYIRIVLSDIHVISMFYYLIFSTETKEKFHRKHNNTGHLKLRNSIFRQLNYTKHTHYVLSNTKTKTNKHKQKTQHKILLKTLNTH